MKIQSERILIRELNTEDSTDLFLIYSDKEAMKFRQTAPLLSLEDAVQTIERARIDIETRTTFRWAIVNLETAKLMGTVVYTPKDLGTAEIGYSLGRDFWGNGYASEVVRLLVEHLQLTGYHKILARTASENFASQRVLLKNQFTLIPTASDQLWYELQTAKTLKSTISILGCGWLGMPLAQHLISLGYVVKGSTTSSTKLSVFKDSGIIPFLINLDDPSTDRAQLHTFLDNSETLIIAIPPRFKHANLAYHLQIEQLLSFIQQSAVKRVFLTSSTSVYGCQAALITETTPTAAESESGQQIVLAENLLLDQSSLKTTILRLGGLFGPNRHPVTFLTQKSEFENPGLSVNMVHLNDVIALTTQLLIQEKDEQNAIYNLVAPYNQTRKQFYERAAMERGLQLPPDTVTDWSLQKKVSGDWVVRQTNTPYLF